MVERKKIVVYKDRNSPSEIAVSLDGVLVNFASMIDSMSVVINGEEYRSQDGYIEFADNGKVTFKLGTVPSPPPKESYGRLVIYSPEFPLGRPIISEKTNYQLIFQFI